MNADIGKHVGKALGGGSLGALALGWIMVVQPMEQEVSELRKEVHELKTEVRVLQAQVGVLQGPASKPWQ